MHVGYLFQNGEFYSAASGIDTSGMADAQRGAKSLRPIFAASIDLVIWKKNSRPLLDTVNKGFTFG
jgi:hypothetical protein